jgi:drug/metabolite transporter (DMT)-like permease
MRRSTSNGLLLLVAVIWGTTFVAQQLGMKDVGPLAYTGARFLLGALCVLPLAWREYVRLHERGIRIGSRDLLAWFGLGTLLFLGAIFQQVGVAGTSVSNAGFLTGLYVPLVPILGWWIDKHKPHFFVWPATLGTLLGTFLLSGGDLKSLGEGDFWIIASTVFWAAHVLYVGRVAAKKGAPIQVAFVQFVVCGVLSGIFALGMETNTVAGMVQGLPAIVYAGVLSVGIAFTLQVVAQRHTHATDAAILLSSEIVFAAIAAAIVLGERLSMTQWLGGALIFVCIVAVQIMPLWEKKA